jgi:hypothetical protein
MHEDPSWIIVSQKAAADIGYEALIPAVVLTALAGTYGGEDVLTTVALVGSHISR